MSLIINYRHTLTLGCPVNLINVITYNDIIMTSSCTYAISVKVSVLCTR